MAVKLGAATGLTVAWLTLGSWWAVAALLTVVLVLAGDVRRRHRPCYVYFGWMIDGTPGYIGESHNPSRRFSSHKRKWWGPHIIKWSIHAACESKREALVLEEQLVRHYRPPFNVEYNDNPRPVPTWH